MKKSQRKIIKRAIFQPTLTGHKKKLNMTIENYIDNINQSYLLGNATEHTFRGDLQQLLEGLAPEVRATNEPKRQSCGVPDYILP